MPTLSNDAGELRSAEGFGDIKAVYAHLHKLEQEIRQISTPEELAALEQADERLQALEEKRGQLVTRYDQGAKQLSRERKKTAAQLSRQVTENMQTLGMNGGHFSIEVTAAGHEVMSPHGRDN